MVFTDSINNIEIKEHLDAYVAMTGMPAGIIDTGHHSLFHSGRQCLCESIHPPGAVAFCPLHEPNSCSSSCGEPIEDNNHGLRTLTIPILVEKQPLAFLRLGQFVIETDPPDRNIHRALSIKHGIDPTAWLKALDETPGFTQKQVESILQYSRTLVKLLAAMTGQSRLQSQLRQAQKMEAIGALSGGIAHDFNNILGVILGFTELAHQEMRNNPETQELLDNVVRASNRAKELTQQILAFSRQDKKEKHPLKLQPLIKEIHRLLRATLPATIVIASDVADNAHPVMADPAQIHQILMNLCTNASHAMRGRHGKLEISLKSVDIDSETVQTNPDLHTGPYTLLIVSDCGHGMNRETMQQVFNPFFTTKAPGEGTGLGLALVHGIVKEYGGAIDIYSELDRGTAVHIYFPAHIGEDSPIQPTVKNYCKGRNQRILFVDDEAPLIRIAERMLKKLGFQPVIFTDPLAALAEFEAAPQSIDLVITDLTMPRMTGVEMAMKMLAIRPEIPVVIATGFSGSWTPEMAFSLGIQDIVTKPVTMATFSEIMGKTFSE